MQAEMTTITSKPANRYAVWLDNHSAKRESLCLILLQYEPKRKNRDFIWDLRSMGGSAKVLHSRLGVGGYTRPLADVISINVLRSRSGGDGYTRPQAEVISTRVLRFSRLMDPKKVFVRFGSFL